MDSRLGLFKYLVPQEDQIIIKSSKLSGDCKKIHALLYPEPSMKGIDSHALLNVIFLKHGLTKISMRLSFIIFATKSKFFFNFDLFLGQIDLNKK